MSTDFNFEVKLDIDGSSYQDINYCCFFRSPVYKQASYCVTRVFLPQILIKILKIAINKNEFPDVDLSIYLNHEERQRKKSKLIYKNSLKCINCLTDEQLQLDQENAHVNLILVHPIIMFLNNTSTYNKILRDMTPYDMLKDFEGYLKSKHGDIFKFIHTGSDSEKNEYTYEQALIRAPNDLNVPSYLIHNYKINHSYSFYFFDNFYITDDLAKEVNCHYINVYDPSKFQQVDITKWTDKSEFSEFQKEIPISDYFEELDKESHRIVLNQSDIRYHHEKEPKTSDVPKRSPGGEVDSSIVKDERKSTFEEPGSQTTSQLSTGKTFSSIYCPDNIENGENRFEIGKETFLEKIEALDLYEFTQCLPDFPQFHNIYNLYQGGNVSKYLVTPLSICNIFKRKNPREQYLYHLSKTLFIRYFRE